MIQFTILFNIFYLYQDDLLIESRVSHRQSIKYPVYIKSITFCYATRVDHDLSI
jgi:hypothetical protein